MSCAVCGREPRGFGYSHRDTRDAPALRACSMQCLNIIVRERGHVIKLPWYETKAVEAAGDAAGAYLDGIGKTDLATLTAEEWSHLIGLIFVTATDRVRKLVEEQEVPF